MKKTLLTAALAAMLLPAATAATGDLLFSSDQTYTTNGNKLTSIALPAASEANAVKMANGFTLSFDLVYISTSKTWPTIINIGESTSLSYFADTGKPNGTADGKWECNAVGYKATPITMSDANQSLSSDANNPSHCILTLTPAEQRTESGESRLYSTLSFYVDGTLVAVSDVSAESYGTASFIWLGGRSNGKNDKWVKATYSNIKVYEGVSTGAIPEPATATLSLLALAGLAARRRRK